MKALWSFRNCKKEEVSRLDLILPLFSVIQWKKYHPKHTTVIYLDADYMVEFEKFGLLQFWDEVRILESRTDINKEHFWSISKIEAIEKESGKIVHVDGDFITFCDLTEYGVFDGDIGVTLLEETKDSDDIAYIDSKKAAEFGGIDGDMFEWDDFADQTSILYLDNDKLKDKFVEDFYEYAKEVSNKKIEHPLGYILFIEQKYLRELGKDMGVKKNYLIKDGFKVSNRGILPNATNGKLGFDEVTQYAYHYGPGKKMFNSDLSMAVHLGTYIFPVINDRNLEAYFWNIYGNKPYVEPNESSDNVFTKLFKKK